MIVMALTAGQRLKNNSNVELGAERNDWKTSSEVDLRDFSSSLRRNEQEEMAERARRADLRMRHYELGLAVRAAKPRRGPTESIARRHIVKS